MWGALIRISGTNCPLRPQVGIKVFQGEREMAADNQILASEMASRVFGVTWWSQKRVSSYI